MRAAVMAAIGGCGAGLAPIASAQNEGGGLEEIVVTATRREMSLQDIPLAVVAISGEGLERQGIENMEDLNGVVPNLVVAGGLAGTDAASFSVRGIPNVGTYVDGIWQVTNNALLLREFVELDRVEVLRGPQGTLYGRDSTGGAIRFYTKPPADEYGVTVDMVVGNLDRRDVKASIDLPFSENFRSRFTVGTYDRDGYITSQVTGFKTGNFEDEVLRADFLWTPTDRVSLRFNAQDDTIVTNTARVQTWIEPQIAYNTGIQMGLAEAYDIASGGQWNCITACSGWAGGQIGEWEGTSEITVPSRQWLEQQTVDLNVALGDNVNFEYLLGHTLVDSRTYNDWDSGPFNFYIDYFNNETDLISHEFQFTGGGDRFTWVAGAYLWDQEDRARGPAWSMREWEDFGNYYNQDQPFSYTNDVLPHPSCQATPADRGVDFTGGTNWLGQPITNNNTVAGWPFPCDWLFGGGWVLALANGARPPAGDRLGVNEVSGYAVFGEMVIGLGESFDVTLGYRFHDQEEDQFIYDVAAGVAAGITAPKPVETNKEWYTGGVYDGVIDPTAPQDHVAFDESTVRLAVSWNVSDEVMLYAGYTEGFDSGGIGRASDSVGDVIISYVPQHIANNEIGVRSDLASGRVRLNATYFQTDWEDVQLLTTVLDRANGTETTELLIQNVADAEVDGFEVELSVAVTDNFLFQANLGFLDTAYVNAYHPSITPGQTEFGQAPEETYNFGFQWDSNLMNGGSLTTRFDASFTSGYWRSSVPSLRRNSYGVPHDFETGDTWLYNARLQYAPPDGRYELSLYGTNLTDEYHLNSGFLHNIWQFDFATVDRPREVGLGMRMFFQ
jgi:iron complex outermembrane receptor protein